MRFKIVVLPESLGSCSLFEFSRNGLGGMGGATFFASCKISSSSESAFSWDCFFSKTSLISVASEKSNLNMKTNCIQFYIMTSWSLLNFIIYRGPNIAESFLPKNFVDIGKFGDIGHPFCTGGLYRSWCPSNLNILFPILLKGKCEI